MLAGIQMNLIILYTSAHKNCNSASNNHTEGKSDFRNLSIFRKFISKLLSVS